MGVTKEEEENQASVVLGQPREEGASEKREWAAGTNPAGETRRTEQRPRTVSSDCTSLEPQQDGSGGSVGRGTRARLGGFSRRMEGGRLKTAWRNSSCVKGRGNETAVAGGGRGILRQFLVVFTPPPLSGFRIEVAVCEQMGMIGQKGKRAELLDRPRLEGWDLVDKWVSPGHPE